MCVCPLLADDPVHIFTFKIRINESVLSDFVTSACHRHCDTYLVQDKYERQQCRKKLSLLEHFRLFPTIDAGDDAAACRAQFLFSSFEFSSRIWYPARLSTKRRRYTFARAFQAFPTAAAATAAPPPPPPPPFVVAACYTTQRGRRDRHAMDDAWVENESPFFSGSSTASRKKPGSTKTYHRRRVPEDRYVNKKKRKAIGRSKTNKVLQSPTTPPPPKRWTPLEVKRCAL